MTAGLDINKIRADFPILAELIRNKPLVYLDNAASGGYRQHRAFIQP
jgi:cysteine desulfurase/selenocysteine lyase